MTKNLTVEEIQREQLAMVQRSEAQADMLAALDTQRLRMTATPQPFYVDTIARCPVVHDADLDFYLLFRMDDILAVNRNPATRQSSVYLGSTRPAIPLGLDGEEHRSYRKLLDPVFAPRRMEAWVPRIRQLANELIDGFIDRGSIDAYRDWAEVLPSTIFLNMLGLPTDNLADFLRFKNLVLGNAELQRLPPEEQVAHRLEAAAWIHGYFNTALDQREASGQPGDDLVGMLLTTEVDGARLTREDIQDILGLLVIAGLDTVAASLACFLSYLARNPEHRAKVVADPSLWPSAVEEMMRFESPVTEGGRILTEEMTLPSGATLPAGAGSASPGIRPTSIPTCSPHR